MIAINHPPPLRRTRRVIDVAGPFPAIARGEVHLWHIHVSDFHTSLQVLERLLSPEERTRLERYQTAAMREQFVAAHGVLRILLSGYTDVPAKRVALVKQPGGKLRMHSKGREIHFNITHARDSVLLAFAWDRQVGIDLELHLPGNAQGLAHYLLPRTEVELFRRIPSSLARSRFGTMWSRMEACAKVSGLGVASTIAAQKRSSFETAPWCKASGAATDLDVPVVRSYRVGPELVCAVASYGENWKLRTLSLVPVTSDNERCTRRSLQCQVRPCYDFERI